MSDQIEEQIARAVVRICGTNYLIHEFRMEFIPDELKNWTLGGIQDPLGQLFAWLWDNIQTALEGVESAIKGTINSAQTYIISTLSGVIDSVKSYLSNAIGNVKTIVDKILDNVNTIATTVSNVSSAITDVKTIINGITSSIGTIISTIDEIKKKIIDGITDILNTIDEKFGIISEIVEIISELATKIKDATDVLSGSIATLSAQMTNLSETLFKWLEDQFLNLQAYFKAEFDAFAEDVAKTWSSVYETFKNWFNDISIGLHNINVAFMGFMNAVLRVNDTLTAFFEKITNFPVLLREYGEAAYNWLTNVAYPAVINAITFAWRTFTGILGDFAKSAYEGLTKIFFAITKFIGSGVKALIDFGVEMKDVLSDPVQGFILALLQAYGKNMNDWFKGFIERIKQGKYMGEFAELALVFSVVFGSQFVARALYLGLKWLGDQLSEIKLAPNVSIKVFGAGAETTLSWKVQLGAIFSHLADEIKEYPDIIGRAFIYGLAIWFSRPLSRALNYGFRNVIPITLPDLDTVTEITKRMLSTNMISQQLSYLRHTMALYGFSDTIINWYTWGPREFSVEITDRFGQKRVIPLAMIYTLPSPSDFCRMMLKDVFASPEDFFNAILARGMIPDVARLYYLLHFKYPSLEKLFEFACRVVAGFGWVTERAKKEAGIGFDGPSPKELSDRYSGDPRKGLNEMVKFLIHYAKWQDYAPFAWLNGFTADRLIMLDMMADIPTRIDARWMYKWALIKDVELFRIVIARGMHPQWWEKVAVAEMMNALAEERTYARTGVLNVFEVGLMDESTVKNVLGNLVTIKLLGKDRVVKFLEGEIKLLVLRSKHDRAVKIFKETWERATRNFVENIMSFDNVIKTMDEIAGAIKDTIGISVSLDKNFIKMFQKSLDLAKQNYTIDRIRYWIRYALYSIFYRISSGMISWEEVESLISDLASKAKMTDEEKGVLEDIARFMYNFFFRKTRIDAILSRVARGVMPRDRAIQELTKLGLGKEEAEALVEERAATYRLTVSQMVTFMEYIPVPENYFKTKMELLGVPKEERPMWKAYAFARVIDEPLKRLQRELEDAYVDGRITRDQYKRELDNLATLWGTAKSKLGVDWIIWSPEEREILLKVADKRREEYLRRRRR